MSPAAKSWQRAGVIVIGGLALVVAVIAAAHSAYTPFRSDSNNQHASVPCAALWQRKMIKHARLMESRRSALTNQARFANRTAYDPFEPTYTCHSEYRRGQLFGDGGKFVCGEPVYFRNAMKGQQKCLVYSVGSNGDASFEQDVFINLGCEIHTFDPTGNSTTYASHVESVGGRFYPIGVSGGVPSTLLNVVSGMHSQLLPIRNIIDMLGHTNRRISILKIDCEGCEYDAFAALWPHVQIREIFVGQIQVELHDTNVSHIASFFKSADEAGFMLFHKERNHWGCMGYLCVEFSLIHKEEAKRIFDFTHC